jgi:hypothetical protein
MFQIFVKPPRTVSRVADDANITASTQMDISNEHRSRIARFVFVLFDERSVKARQRHFENNVVAFSLRDARNRYRTHNARSRGRCVVN